MINQVTEEESFKEIGQPASSATAGPPHTSLQSPELLGEIGFPLLQPFLSPSGGAQSCGVCVCVHMCVCVCMENDKQPCAHVDTINIATGSL